MPKFRMKYRPPVEGVKIEVKTEEAYQKLVACARANRCTIGQWAEAKLIYVLRDDPFVPTMKRPPKVTPTKRPRSFELSEHLYAEIEHRVGEDKAKPWIGRTLLGLATIEVERLRGEQVEHEWRDKYKI